MRIAIVGTGISGLTAAYLLHQEHEITLFEGASRIGGHTATMNVSVGNRDYAIDTGFIVYNDWTYPHFIRLMERIGVHSQATEMGFSVSCEQTGLEYSGNSFNTLFAQRRNLLRLDHWRMLRDIVRFNREAKVHLLEGRISSQLSLGDYLHSHDYSRAFRDFYLIPMGAAIWSSGRQHMLDFPALFFLRFFNNHGLLNINDRPQWRVIKGGSSAYLSPLIASFRDRIHLSCPVTSITRSSDGVLLRHAEGEAHFDQVIIASHSDQALALLADPSPLEKQILGAIPYLDNEVILHTDTRQLPHNQATWSSWNYRLKAGPQDQDNLPVLTYNMNILQGIDSETTFCVTLNDTGTIDPTQILGRYTYAHPQFSIAGIDAQQQWRSINGVQRTWFCGAYWGNGFHEDGVSSGLRVAQALGGESL
ncbi:NAD(P)/FAD-dependent oxidoreductase [Aestuariirhabdus litorea]|uniref:FAD-dependent oxidoreductase n=1 Tax=Aestuariirhabdus litorea TaxID=2528527 RepID=A0A3P3VMB9_9GAMM|nr:FAD-dependent oxidoreductase [Aestuariirhabdus litorea]RRJ83835.1 FAD-dependent oxidoreductase [Aestuariirhabdus litorea]RWW97058.1 FAD-dependent oxidoreductase [Endozoicomonadaceae bacterium GTF-13]